MSGKVLQHPQFHEELSFKTTTFIN